MPVIQPGDRGPCPHCGTVVLFEMTREKRPGNAHWGRGGGGIEYRDGPDSAITLHGAGCPNCQRSILTAHVPGPLIGDVKTRTQAILWPKSRTVEVPPEVPVEIARDYHEARAVEGISQRAAAALARRCLQTVLVQAGKAKEKATLEKQIEQVLPTLPLHIAENVDAIRAIGNFAAHPIKSDDPARLVDVEEDEVEWILGVLRELFDFYYVAPAKSAAHRQRLNTKLAGAKKPPLKKP